MSVEALANIVVQEGYTVVKALDGLAGFNLIRSCTFLRIVVIDLFMPGIDGIDLHRYLKTEPQFETIKTIILSPLTLEETLAILDTSADFYHRQRVYHGCRRPMFVQKLTTFLG